MLSVLLLIALQDVEKLGSERAEEREAAARALLELGQKARPLLEDGAKHADPEIAGRARDLLAALDRRLESFAHVLEKLRKDASPQRLLRDATQALRERCRDREWSEIKLALERQGFRPLEVRKGQHWTTWPFLAREGEFVAPAGLRHDLILELETSIETSKTEPSKQVLRQAKAVLVWKGKTDVSAIEAKPYPEGIFRGIFSQPLFRVDLGPYPILEELEVSYRHLVDRWQEHNPWGFLVVARLANRDRTAGKTFIFHVPSGLDPFQDHTGRNAPGAFVAGDTLGEWRTSGGSEWKSGKRELTTLRRVEPRKASTSPEEVEVRGPGDLKGLPDDTTSLALVGDVFGDDDCAGLVRFAKLRRLSIGDSRAITGAGLAPLARLPELETLSLSSHAVDDEALRSVSSCPKLKSLSVSWSSRVSDAGVANLARLKTLSDLRLHWGEGLTDESLRHLSALSGLKTLRLWGAGKLTDGGLEPLSKLTGLEDLTLSHSTSWTAAGLAKLETLRSLRVLTLGYAPVDDETLKTLGRLPALEEIWLRGLEVTDAGLLELKGLTKLRFLHLDGCKKTSSEGLRALRAVLPGEYVLE